MNNKKKYCMFLTATVNLEGMEFYISVSTFVAKLTMSTAAKK